MKYSSEWTALHHKQADELGDFCDYILSNLCKSFSVGRNFSSCILDLWVVCNFDVFQLYELLLAAQNLIQLSLLHMW